MIWKKTKQPLNAAIITIGFILLFYSICAAVLTGMWYNAVDGAVFCVTSFVVVAVLLLILAVLFLRENSKRPVRDRFKYWSLIPSAAAVIVIVCVELYNGYILNTADVKRKRLGEFFYGELDETKLCAALLSGKDPSSEPFASGKAADIIKSEGVPKFKSIYTGDLASSFGDGGNVYTKLGNHSIQLMRDAAAKRDSKAFVEASALSAKIIANAASVLKDPSGAALKLGNDYVQVLQESVTTTFPADSDFEKFLEKLNTLRETYSYSHHRDVVFYTFSILSRFDRLLKKGSAIGSVTDGKGMPLWSDFDLFSGNLFPTARRGRIIADYVQCVSALNVLRVASVSGTMTVKTRIESLNKLFDGFQKKKHFICLALIPDNRARFVMVGAVQRKLEGAHFACEVEFYRRTLKKLPAKLEDAASPRMMSIPVCHIDGSQYQLIKGRFKSASGVHPGYALQTASGSFVIVDRR